MDRVFKAVENTVGQPNVQHRIIFSNSEDLESFRQAIDDGEDVFVLGKDGVTISFKNHDINYQIYEGKIVLGAKKIGGK